MRTSYVFGLIFIMAAVGCGSPAQKKDQSKKSERDSDQSAMDVSQSVTKFKPFYVYSNKGSRENHFVPSGFMPDGKCLSFDDTWQTSCQAGQTCIKIDYDVECSEKVQKWGGIYWLNPANNWGKRKGGFDLTGAQRLTFWARGEHGGEQIQEFISGGITGDFADSDIAVIGPVILSPEWKRYDIDLRGKDLSYVSGGFAWSTSTDVNSVNVTFYLDEVRYE